MEPRVNTSKHTNTILSLQCDACLQEQFPSKSEFDSQTRYTRTHIEVAQRKTITLSPALSHLPHTLTVELPMMPSSWVTSWRGQNLVPRTNQPYGPAEVPCHKYVAPLRLTTRSMPTRSVSWVPRLARAHQLPTARVRRWTNAHLTTVPSHRSQCPAAPHLPMLLTQTHQAAHCVPQDWHHESGSDTPALLSLQDGYCGSAPPARCGSCGCDCNTVLGTVGAGGGGGMFDASTV